MPSFSSLLEPHPAAQQKLLPDSVKNLRMAYDAPGAPAWAKTSIEELFSLAAWNELNDRFYKTLSFATAGTPRPLSVQAGLVSTASHNPAHDNGFKAYFADGGQLVEPHATGVIDEFNKITDFSEGSIASVRYQTVPADAEKDYLASLQCLIL